MKAMINRSRRASPTPTRGRSLKLVRVGAGYDRKRRCIDIPPGIGYYGD